jgi:signal transduction histidine kinase
LIAKKLVEAQGGRMWVDTEVNSGSTFSVVLPVELEG